MSGTAKAEFVERLTRWLMPDSRDPDLAAAAREKMSLDGVYLGDSRRIHRLVKLAYLRGVRRGAGCAWEAQQPIALRSARPSFSPGDRVKTSHGGVGEVLGVLVKIRYDGETDPALDAYIPIELVSPEGGP